MYLIVRGLINEAITGQTKQIQSIIFGGDFGSNNANNCSYGDLSVTRLVFDH